MRRRLTDYKKRVGERMAILVLADGLAPNHEPELWGRMDGLMKFFVTISEPARSIVCSSATADYLRDPRSGKGRV